METEIEVKTKVYELLPHSKPTAPISILVTPKDKVRMDVLKKFDAYKTMTITTKENKQRRLRFKLNSNYIFQDDQIKHEQIPANEKFTDDEMNALRFKNGFLITDVEIVQRFLEASPQFQGFEGKSSIKPMYRLVDVDKEIEDEDAAFQLRRKAANKIAEFNEVEAGEMLLKLNGSFYPVPEGLKRRRQALVQWMDSASDDSLKDLVKEDTSVDEAITILIGKAIGLGIIDFLEVPNQVSWIISEKDGVKEFRDLKEIPSSYSLPDRKMYFGQFLNSSDGKLVRNDIEARIKEIETPKTADGAKMKLPGSGGENPDAKGAVN